MAGLACGSHILSVDGNALRDIIDWRWYSDEDEIELVYLDAEDVDDAKTLILKRSPGQDWGIEFEHPIFDEVKTCRNSCSFCFMRQLPQGVRPSLTLRDDDFRLSFLQGTFATLTNIKPEDEKRILEQHLSPLRISLHAVDSKVRHELVGKHEAHGFSVMERLLSRGIEMHIQIVLVPGVNDGTVLEETLSWAYDQPGILELAVVPLGYTRFQTKFESSYNNPQDAREVLDILKPFQARALEERGGMWAFAADEFYRNAYGDSLLEELPSAQSYGSYDMFEDGIGIIRSTVDSWLESRELIDKSARALKKKAMRVHHIMGEAQREFMPRLINESSLDTLLIPFFVKNNYFGGNVDVTGLLTGIDIVDTLNQASGKGERIDLALLPKVIFNEDGLTLDDMSLEDIRCLTSVPLEMVSCNPSEYLQEICSFVSRNE